MINIAELTKLCEELGCRITPECSLSEYITFRFGGPCRALVSVNSVESAAKLIEYMKTNGIKYGILGRGSNVLAADEGFDGVILLFGSDFSQIEVKGNTIRCDAGASLASACVHAQQNGLSGMENLFGIPGTVGGALYMNAGAYGSEMKDVVLSAEYIDENCRIRSISAKDMELSYRHSVFSGTSNVITSVTMQLTEGDPAEIKARMNECMSKRSSKQPLEYPSAGSTFKRPEGFFAGKLIMDAGLRGYSVGDACVSEKHCGFVINKGTATAEDVCTLMKNVSAKIKDTFGVTLEPEVRIIGREL